MELPCILIDVGTATTFDIVSENGGYEGGIIVPGPQGFLDFLSQKTALLPDVELKKNVKKKTLSVRKPKKQC